MANNQGKNKYDWSTYKPPPEANVAAGKARMYHPGQVGAGGAGVVEVPYSSVPQYESQQYKLVGTFGAPAPKAPAAPAQEPKAPTAPTAPTPAAPTTDKYKVPGMLEAAGIPPEGERAGKAGMLGEMQKLAGEPVSGLDLPKPFEPKYRPEEERILKGIPEEPYQFKYRPEIMEALGAVKKPFEYDPRQDPYLRMAQEDVMQKTLAEFNRRGILGSTITAERAALEAGKLEPQYYQLAYNRYQDNIANQLRRADVLRNLDLDDYNAYQQNIENLFRKVSEYRNLDADDLLAYQTNMDTIFRNAENNLQERRFQFGKVADTLTKAYEKIQNQGYVDNETSAITGLPVGSMSEQLRTSLLDYIRTYETNSQQLENQLTQLREQNELNKDYHRFEQEFGDARNAAAATILAKYRDMPASSALEDFTRNLASYTQDVGGTMAFQILENLKQRKNIEQLGNEMLKISDLTPNEQAKSIMGNIDVYEKALGDNFPQFVEAINKQKRDYKIKTDEIEANKLAMSELDNLSYDQAVDWFKNNKEKIKDLDPLAQINLQNNILERKQIDQENYYGNIIATIASLTSKDALEFITANSGEISKNIGAENLGELVDGLRKISLDEREMDLKNTREWQKINNDWELKQAGLGIEARYKERMAATEERYKERLATVGEKEMESEMAANELLDVYKFKDEIDELYTTKETREYVGAGEGYLPGDERKQDVSYITFENRENIRNLINTMHKAGSISDNQMLWLKSAYGIETAREEEE